MQSYAEFPELAHVYLEDSYVLEIRETEASVTFVLDAVLTPGHPGWAEPGPDEQHCYVPATLTLAGATEVRWLRRSARTYRDATGATDLGNIDRLVLDGDHYEVAGDWGDVWVFAATPPSFEITTR
jgi:hypothetical protein